MVASVVQSLTSVPATTDTNIHTAIGDENLKIRITNNNVGVAKIKLSLSTTTATQQASGKLVADDFEIPAKTTYVDKTKMKTANEFLVLYSDVALNTVVEGVKL